MTESSRALVSTEPTPPYLPFPRFYSFLKEIEKYHLPGGSFIPDQALEDQTDEERRLLLRALDFFHLLDAEMVMTAAMQVYLQNSDLSQKMAMRQWIITSYPPDLFEAIAEKDGEGISAAFPDHLSQTVKNRCMAFLRRFASIVALDLSAVSANRNFFTRGFTQNVGDVTKKHTSPSFWTETILALDWGRFCILKHDGPLSADDIERIEKGLDILTESKESRKKGGIGMTKDDYTHIQRLQAQINMLAIMLSEVVKTPGGASFHIIKRRIEDIAVQVTGEDDHPNIAMEEMRKKFLKFLDT